MKNYIGLQFWSVVFTYEGSIINSCADCVNLFRPLTHRWINSYHIVILLKQSTPGPKLPHPRYLLQFYSFLRISINLKSVLLTV
jgi:hypothetical protein